MERAKSPPQTSSIQHSRQPSYASRGYGAAATPPANIGTTALSRTPSQASSYLPASQQQQHHQLQDPQPQSVDHDQTLANTVANSRLASPDAETDTWLAAPVPTRPAKFTEEWDASQRGSSIIDGPAAAAANAKRMSSIQRSNSASGGSVAGDGTTTGGSQLSRGNTLKKKPSMSRSASLKRSGSRRSMKAGSVRSMALQTATDEDELHSAFYCPVPTSGNPTEALATRFHAWRKILKDLITYFREIQAHYDHRSKSLLKLANVLNNTQTPAGFIQSGGLDDALKILRNYNKLAVLEANKAREIEEDVILALTGLRSDLQQKIKEIKSLSGDFKNSVDREMEVTGKAVKALQEVLGQTELDSSLTTGKQDPYLLRLAVDRQLDRQIDEENYLHQAYLNIENSGRELETIVVGEIQKSYNAYAGILKRESDAAYTAVDELRVGPIAMPKDHEWMSFVKKDAQFVDPNIPIRSAQNIHYPGRDHYACQEIRAGLLERKTKYLKSYTAGWYVLSPTHLHEYKSADKTQAPLMSLYLPEQKLGSHSSEGGSSNKFILKGRQTGGMHRGHTWVFRAESHDTMMAWYEDIKALTEKTPQERSEFVWGHTRSRSRASQRSFSSDGVVDDEDEEPFSAHNSTAALHQNPQQDVLPRRPSPGGRFPSDLQVNPQRGLQAPVSPSSVGSGSSNQFANQNQNQNQNQIQNSNADHEVIAAAGALPGSGVGQHYQDGHDPRYGYGSTAQTPMNEAHSHAAVVSREAEADGVNPFTSQPIQHDTTGRFGEPPNPDAGVGPGVGGTRGLDSHDTTTAGSGAWTADGRAPQQFDNEQRVSYIATGDWASGGRPVSGISDQAGPAHYPTSVATSQGQPSDTLSNSTDNGETFALGGGNPSLHSGHQTADPNSWTAPQQQVNGPSYQAGKVARPTAGTARTNDSIPTISNLHIPGEYPRQQANH